MTHRSCCRALLRKITVIKSVYFLDSIYLVHRRGTIHLERYAPLGDLDIKFFVFLDLTPEFPDIEKSIKIAVDKMETRNLALTVSRSELKFKKQPSSPGTNIISCYYNPPKQGKKK
jgi:hypothetical protein